MFGIRLAIVEHHSFEVPTSTTISCYPDVQAGQNIIFDPLGPKAEHTDCTQTL
jgi:hypothetical protein